MGRKYKTPWLLGFAVLLLVGTAGWALYSLLNSSVGGVLGFLGVMNDVVRNLVTFVFVLLLLVVLGLWAGRRKGSRNFIRVIKRSLERIAK